MDEKDVDFEHRLTQVESNVSNQQRRLEDVERRQDDLDKLVSCVNTLSVNQKHMDGDLQEIKSDVKSLTVKPAKRWEKVIETLIGVLVGAFFGWLVAGAPGA